MHAVLPALIAWIAPTFRSRAAMQLEVLVTCLVLPNGNEIGRPPVILASGEDIQPICKPQR